MAIKTYNITTRQLLDIINNGRSDGCSISRATLQRQAKHNLYPAGLCVKIAGVYFFSADAAEHVEIRPKGRPRKHLT